MITMAFESSAKAASVALVRDGTLLGQYSQCTSLTHSRTLLPMAEDLLNNCEMDIKDIDLFAVAQGPGSFTGIRIGVATVKGLAWSGGKKCVGVSTLEALAWHGVSHSGIICPVMDARRNQVYNALFRIEDGRPVRLCEDRAISLAELSDELLSSNLSAFLVGDGYSVTADYFSNTSVSFSTAPENLLYQSAWGVAKAAESAVPVSSEELIPVYLRLSQAERERLERMKG